jgi:uncharacterized membrane protein (UPF0127 family)
MQKFIVLLAAFGLLGCSPSDLKITEQESDIVTSDSSDQAANTQPLMIGEQKFYVEVAQTVEERQQGLMYRETMPANQGMIFNFSNEAPRNFWMKNTLIPLDMIWIDANKTIVDIQAAEPCKVENCPIYSGAAPAQYVLELNQEVLRAQVGDRVEF